MPTNSQLDSFGVGLEDVHGSTKKNSDLEMGDVWLGDLATSQFRDLGQVYFLFAFLLHYL